MLLGLIINCRLIIFSTDSSVTRTENKIVVLYHSLVKGVYILLPISFKTIKVQDHWKEFKLNVFTGRGDA